jgi:predicted transcriptional regulator
VNVKTDIAMPEKLFARVNGLADAEGLSRSGVILRAVEHYVPHEKWRRIKESYDEAYADGPDEGEKASLRFGTAQMAKHAQEDPWEG